MMVNFAVQASGAHDVTLVLFTPADLASGRVSAELALDPGANRTGDVWHVMLPVSDASLAFGWRAAGPNQDDAAEDDDAGAPGPAAGHGYDAGVVLLDPYAKAVVGRSRYGELGPDLPYGSPGVVGLARTWPQAAAALPAPDAYDWEGDRPLGLPMQDLVIYEMHVRGFTASPSSGVGERARGTYAALAARLDYLATLGVNAVELLPVHEFNELEYCQVTPTGPSGRVNYWGYSTVGYFAPMARYASAGGGGGRAVVDEFRDMVKACHRRGIEVILDVVFNHTAEGNEQGPCVSFR